MFWLAIVICFLLVSPVLIVLIFGSGSALPAVDHLLQTEIASNTFCLIISVVIISLVLGVIPAWIVSRFDFPGRKLISWLLILPLSIPAYIAAFTYKGILDPYGTLMKYTGLYFEVKGILFLALILAFVLYPYIYLFARAGFQSDLTALTNASLNLGKSRIYTFFKIELPLTFLPIFSGTLLVVMEVLNNYGAVHHLGVNTFSTEIVRIWNPMNNSGVLGVSFWLIVFVFGLLFVEQITRKKNRIKLTSNTISNRVNIRGNLKWIAITICLIPFIFGGFIPVIQLFAWALNEIDLLYRPDFIQAVFLTLRLASLSALVCIVIAWILGKFESRNYGFTTSIITKLSTLGYAIPGVVLGVGILVPIKWFNDNFDILLTGSLLIMSFGYVVRFNTMAFGAISSGYRKIGTDVMEASSLMAKSKFEVLKRIEFPLLKKYILVGALLVFIDVSRELPLTMMFQTFNMETLAIHAFRLMETDGAVYTAAVPALILVLIGTIPAFGVNKMMQ